MIFFGFILLAVAVGCYFGGRSQAGKLRTISVTDTYSAQMVQDLYSQVVPTLGAEALAQVCEVAGVIEAEQPLSAPLSGTPCVAYSLQVSREYEADVTTTDSNGVKKTTTERRSETVESREQKVRFFVRDATGRVLIDPAEAELDLAASIDRTDVPPAHAPARTLGYRRAERMLPVGTQVYILGTIVANAGTPVIARDPRGKQKFLISRRSEQELISEASSAARWFYYAAGGAGGVGLVLLVAGMIW